MPTETWLQEHQQVTFYLPRELHRRFKIACLSAGKNQADVLREAVAAMLPDASERPHDGAQGQENGKGA